MPLAARASALARFAFWIQTESSNAPLLSTKQIESWDDNRCGMKTIALQ
jgi:hypothetical protein